jgi:type I restriction-modification system DNA methylase subunit
MTRAARRIGASATEVDAYIFIKQALGALGWDIRNPDRNPAGQVYTQNECLSHPEIKRLLNLDKPENIIKVTDKLLWVIEAKRSHRQLEQAISEAIDYATKLNQSRIIKAAFVSGVVGNDADTYVIRNRFLKNGEFVPISLNSIEMTGLLSPSHCDFVLHDGLTNIENPPIDERLFVSRAEKINEILHLGAVNPHQRAAVMAALLLSTSSSTGPNIEEKSPIVLIEDINARCRSVLRAQGKSEFEEYIRIALPATQDNHVKFRQALIDTIQELNLLNIRSAMNSGADWLGTFYEVFLKYANWAQDLGIVLTPRHITRYVADVMSIKPSDLIYDPTCGTGGFLVAGLDAVKQRSSEAQVTTFKRNSVFGIEQDSGIAALAVVNMIFRGDGKNNISEGNCMAKFLQKSTNGELPTAKYAAEPTDDPPITKVMMNPPFALKRGSDKEYKFIDQAFRQMEHGGSLFSVLPYSTMVRPGGYLSWRKLQLLPFHTLLAVVTLPIDLFYPVGVTSVGVFVRKGVPHPPGADVLWIRALNDGFLKSKGKRLPNQRAPDDLATVRDTLRAFIENQTHTVAGIEQFIKACPIDFSDRQLELVPEAYLDQSEPTHKVVVNGLETAVREMFSYLIKINRASLKPDLIRDKAVVSTSRPVGWKKYLVTEIFDLKRGHFHSLANLDPGAYPTISRVSTDNGMVGFFDKPDDARVWEPGTITVSTVTGDAFIQPVPFIATDNVVMCVPKKHYGNLPLSVLFFIQFMINDVKWRYSYGRQCYQRKFAKTEIVLPVTTQGKMDLGYMGEQVENATYWPLVARTFSEAPR